MKSGLLVVVAALGLVGCPPGHTTPDSGPDARDIVDGGLCPSVDFVSPAPDAVLGPADDVDGSCGNGFQYDVVVATNARQGSTLELFVNGMRRSMATVAGPQVTFRGVEFDTRGSAQLSVRVAGATEDCASPRAVTVNCDTPTCRIVEPMATALNRSHNVDSMGYAVQFAVETDAEAGQTVTLAVSSLPDPLTATVAGGRAVFRSVRLQPDGEHRVQAQCVNRAGTVGRSAQATYTVDSVPPVLAVRTPMAGAVVPFSEDANAMAPGRQFRVCGTSDAAGQTACARIAGATPDMPGGCTAVPESATTEFCTEVTCPSGSAPFTVEFAVSDPAGNESVVSVMNVSCASSLPSVRVVDPPAYSPMMPATALTATDDADPMRDGLQYNVVVCSDVSVGTATLQLGMVDVPGSVPLAPAAAGDPCAMAGLAGIARFMGVSIPETTPERVAAGDPPPTNPILSARVVAPSGEGVSPTVSLFVDTRPPVVSFDRPVCGSVIRTTTGTATTDIRILSDTLPVTLTLRASGSSPITLTESMYSGMFRVVTFRNVMLTEGTWEGIASATDPAGNTGTSEPCRYQVGNPPVVTFASPTDGAVFNASTDPDRAMPGHQNVTINVRTDAPAGTVLTLTVNGGSPVTAMATAAGTATFGPLTLPEGDVVALEVVTADVPGRGVGRAAINVVVDTQPPGSPSALVGTVVNRRAGQARVTFTNAPDPATPPRAVARYDVRFRYDGPVTTANFESSMAAASPPMPGGAGTPGAVDLTNLRVYTPVFVGMRAIDVGGNVGPVAAVGPIELGIRSLRIADPSTRIGNTLSGGYDVNGDGIQDLVVGSLDGQVRIYFGSTTGLSETNYTVIAGSSGSFFGAGAASLGDFDGDGVGDVAVAERGAFAASPGRVLIYLGRGPSSGRTWPPASAPLTPMDADVIITTSSGGDFANANFGFSLAAAGDFNGDSRADLVVGAPLASNGPTARAGAAFVYLGRPVTGARPMMLDTVTDAVLMVRGTTEQFRLGSNVQGMGRLVGGDTLSDVAIQADGADFRGHVFLFAGRSGAMAVELPIASAAFTREGSAPSRFENRVSPVGDINADGLPDMAIGTGSGPGTVYLFFGSAGGRLVSGPTIANTGGGSTDAFGVFIGRINDASPLRPSLLEGAPQGADLAVATTFWMGGDPILALFGARMSWTGLTASRFDWSFTASRGGATTAQTLFSPSWVGDVNQDGHPDLAFGQAVGQNAFYLLY